MLAEAFVFTWNLALRNTGRILTITVAGLIGPKLAALFPSRRSRGVIVFVLFLVFFVSYSDYLCHEDTTERLLGSAILCHDITRAAAQALLRLCVYLHVPCVFMWIAVPVRDNAAMLQSLLLSGWWGVTGSAAAVSVQYVLCNTFAIGWHLSCVAAVCCGGYTLVPTSMLWQQLKCCSTMNSLFYMLLMFYLGVVSLIGLTWTLGIDGWLVPSGVWWMLSVAVNISIHFVSGTRANWGFSQLQKWMMVPVYPMWSQERILKQRSWKNLSMLRKVAHKMGISRS